MQVAYSTDGTCFSGEDKEYEKLEKKLAYLKKQSEDTLIIVGNIKSEIARLDEQNYIDSQEMEFLKIKWGIKDPE